MPEHTPGPWVCLDLNGGKGNEPIYSSDTMRRPVAVAYLWHDHPDYDPLANARLIAESPGLLGLAREWIALWDGGYSPQLLQDHTDKCRAILARAGGVAS